MFSWKHFRTDTRSWAIFFSTTRTEWLLLRRVSRLIQALLMVFRHEAPVSSAHDIAARLAGGEGRHGQCNALQRVSFDFEQRFQGGVAAACGYDSAFSCVKQATKTPRRLCRRLSVILLVCFVTVFDAPMNGVDFSVVEAGNFSLSNLDPEFPRDSNRLRSLTQTPHIHSTIAQHTDQNRRKSIRTDPVDLPHQTPHHPQPLLVSFCLFVLFFSCSFFS